MTRPLVPRRRLVAGLAGAVLLPATAGAARLIATPWQTEGPFYPQKPQRSRDEDMDLVTIRGRSDRAAGEIIHVTGRVMRPDGRPVARARIEVWQANAAGVYNHPGDGHDETFQGYGTMLTDAEGRYRFRTIKPGSYGSATFRRTPHIHFKVAGLGVKGLTTQMYFAGEPENDRDAILNGIRDAERRARLIVPFRPSPGVEPHSRSGAFDIVMGHAG